MYYGGLRDKRFDASRDHIVGSLLRLRKGLNSSVPEKRPGSVRLATWNIREFGGRKHGGRTDEALYCIAEIISRFDIVAVQEVRPDLYALDRVMGLLGRDWDRIFTDVSYAKSGNQERLAFLWDRRNVRFTGLAGELVLPEVESKELAQIARTPFICGFQAGWAKFNLCTVHMYFGEGANDERRVAEIAETGKLLSKKAKDYIKLDEENRRIYSPENLVLLGDFNIFKKSDKTFDALAKSGFVLPKELMKDELSGSNVARNKFYDQIVFFKEVRDIENTKAGIFDFYEHIYRDEDAARFVETKHIADKAKFKDWRTYQMSDHLVMWAEFTVDKADDYLKGLRKV
ncbi:endonuclease/exonuclease/phosphatase family protein [Hyphomicrobium sp. CS1BSMeth3]|uniref:endonuclease/exonuclease/phosphatase family protein n=1 Tax=Hyphomicrobium sp. CS1BSMeth3 TaxID=1892844 RepID=UPI00093172C1|nr:endonuclease/exonuclease/phosphatase family protein [Hyphomicrobium sp. CS1BSMeth3]